MKDKLRELAERWRAWREGSDWSIGIRKTCAAELLAILDAEGDGGAVGVDKEAVLALINPLLSAGTFEAPDWAIRVAAICMDCNLAESTHPARSGVVSDEDVEAACRKYYNCGHPVYPPVFEAMRAALESFQKGRCVK